MQLCGSWLKFTNFHSSFHRHLTGCPPFMRTYNQLLPTIMYSIFGLLSNPSFHLMLSYIRVPHKNVALLFSLVSRMRFKTQLLGFLLRFLKQNKNFRILFDRTLCTAAVFYSFRMFKSCVCCLRFNVLLTARCQNFAHCLQVQRDPTLLFATYTSSLAFNHYSTVL